jgi:hypothetical protein
MVIMCTTVTFISKNHSLFNLNIYYAPAQKLYLNLTPVYCLYFTEN